MAGVTKTNAIILRSYPFRETSYIVTFLTREHGKLKGICKGVRGGKERPHLISHFEPGCAVTLLFYFKENRELQLITDSILRYRRGPVLADFDRICVALYLVDLVDNGVQVGMRCDDVYSLLDWALSVLPFAKDMQKIIAVCEVKLLDFYGIFPSTERCAVCGKGRMSGRLFFSPQQGGVLCGDNECRRKGQDGFFITDGTIATMEYLRSCCVSRLNRFSISKQLRAELAMIMAQSYRIHFQREVKSYSFIQEITGVSEIGQHKKYTL